MLWNQKQKEKERKKKHASRVQLMPAVLLNECSGQLSHTPCFFHSSYKYPLHHFTSSPLSRPFPILSLLLNTEEIKKKKKRKKRRKSMVFPMAFLKLANWVLYQLLANSCYKAARKMRNYDFLLGNPSLKSSQQPCLFPSVAKCGLDKRASHTLVCDIQGTLLRSSQSFFPYFMLVAFEGGSIVRAFLLLLSWPILWFVDYELKLRAMIFISFCGLKLKDVESVSRAVLPKFYLENLNLEAYKVLASTGSKVVFTSVPRVLVEGFLKEYLGVGDVVGTELQTVGKYYTGLLAGESGLVVKHRALKDYFGDANPDIGLGTLSLHDHLFISLCKVF
jgi:glycerol-3-phosphate acyltransferase